MSNAMQTDYSKESLATVAIKFPTTGRPSLFKSSYAPRTWQNMVAQAHLDRNIVAIFVMEDSEEGQAILRGTNPSDITPEFLMGMEEDRLREMAEAYEVKTTAKNNKKAIALKIMAAIADGMKPKAIPAQTV